MRFELQRLGCLLVVAGHEDDRQVHVALADAAREFAAAELGHDDVGDEPGDHILVLRVCLECLGAVSGGEDGVPGVREDLLREVADDLLVLGEQDRRRIGLATAPATGRCNASVVPWPRVLSSSTKPPLCVTVP